MRRRRTLEARGVKTSDYVTDYDFRVDRIAHSRVHVHTSRIELARTRIQSLLHCNAEWS